MASPQQQQYPATAERPATKRGRPGDEEADTENRPWRANTTSSGGGSGGGGKPRLPSCLVGATPEINAAALRGGNGGSGGPQSGGALAVETDPHRLRQRQKQVDYGKNTLGYDRYLQLVPKEARRRTDPRTPDIHAKMPTKRFNGLVRAWRRRLHEFDPVEATATATAAAHHPSPAVAALFSPGPSTVGARSAPATAGRPKAARTPVSHAKTDRADEEEEEEEEEGGGVDDYAGEEEGGGLEEAAAMGASAGMEEDDEGGPSCKKKSRVGTGGGECPYMEDEGPAEADEEGAMDESSPLPSVDGKAPGGGWGAVVSPGQDTDRDEEEMDCGYEIKRGEGEGAAFVDDAVGWGAGHHHQAAVDEEVCYSDDDLL